MKCILFTGGIDSLSASVLLPEYDLVYCKIGHVYQQEELNAVLAMGRLLQKDIKIIDAVNLGNFEKDNANIPMRNLFLVMETILLGYTEIVMVAQKDEMTMLDKTPKFYKDTSALLSYLNETTIKVFTPFEHMDKTQIVAKLLKTHPRALTLLKNSHSCYHPVKGSECGNCSACYRKAIALVNNGLFNLLGNFYINPMESSISLEYAKKATSYSNLRQKRMTDGHKAYTAYKEKL